MSTTHPFVPLQYERRPEPEMMRRASEWLEESQARRSTRQFSADPVARELIEHAILTAGTAPSGAHLQPWTFVAISNPALKASIRQAAEEEERQFYERRATEEWLRDLAPLGTDQVKEHITTAPWLVVLFKHTKRPRPDGSLAPTYYASESAGIAAGFFIAAIHRMGLCTLPHTPSPMGFLRSTLGRPDYETPLLLMPVGYPAPDARVPALARKPLESISVFVED